MACCIIKEKETQWPIPINQPFGFGDERVPPASQRNRDDTDNVRVSHDPGLQDEEPPTLPTNYEGPQSAAVNTRQSNDPGIQEPLVCQPHDHPICIEERAKNRRQTPQRPQTSQRPQSPQQPQREEQPTMCQPYHAPRCAELRRQTQQRAQNAQRPQTPQRPQVPQAPQMPQAPQRTQTAGGAQASNVLHQVVYRYIPQLGGQQYIDNSYIYDGRRQDGQEPVGYQWIDQRNVYTEEEFRDALQGLGGSTNVQSIPSGLTGGNQYIKSRSVFENHRQSGNQHVRNRYVYRA